MVRKNLYKTCFVVTHIDADDGTAIVDGVVMDEETAKEWVRTLNSTGMDNPDYTTIDLNSVVALKELEASLVGEE